MKCTAAAFAVSIASVALAQSFNVDIDATSGAGAGAPSGELAGAAGTAGTWTSINSTASTPFALRRLSGATSLATLTRTGTVTLFSQNNVNTSGDFDLLLDDLDSFTTGTEVTYTFRQLLPGRYEVYTYAIAPDNSAYRTTIAVTGALEAAATIGGTMPVNAFARGVTHALHTVDVSSAGELRVTASTTSPFGSVNGFQVKLIAPTRIYVKQTATASDGLTWASAFTTLDSALAYAAANTSVREIWVSQGVYRPTVRSIAADPRSVRFSLVNNVSIIGGFLGSEATLDQRPDPSLHPTIMDGEIGLVGPTDNAYNVIFSIVSYARINGLRITHAWNTLNSCGSGCSQAYGGGIRHDAGTLRVEQCDIVDNYAEPNALAGFGGGVMSLGTLELVNTTVRNNLARFGGGVYAIAPRIFNCRFLSNTATLSGGGLAVGGLGTAFVDNCYFASNIANDQPIIQGGSAISNVTVTIVANCTFVRNAGNANANVLTTNPLSPAGSEIQLYNSIIWNNQTPPISGAATVRNCDIQGGYAGVGNIDANPRFRNLGGADGTIGTPDDDPTVLPFSPCIDAGTISGIPADILDLDGDGNTSELVPLDLLGNPRLHDDAGIANTGSGFFNYIDIGCTESQFTSCRADYNLDTTVDFFDYLDFVNDFAAGRAAADFNGDGVLDFFDYLDFVQALSAGC